MWFPPCTGSYLVLLPFSFSLSSFFAFADTVAVAVINLIPRLFFPLFLDMSLPLLPFDAALVLPFSFLVYKSPLLF